MQLTPLTHTHIDRRLQDIDRQISSALRDIRRNLEELERASSRPDDKGFAGALRKAMDRDGASR
jgi:hypothetical protein